MNWIMFLYMAVLIFILSPGVLFTVPLKNEKLVASIHAILISLVWALTHKMIWKASV